MPFIGTRTARRSAELTADARGRLAHSVTDSVQGITEITGYGLHPARLEQASSIARDLEIAEHGAARAAAVRRLIALTIRILTTVAVAGVGLGLGGDPVFVAAATIVTLRSFDVTKGIEDFLVAADASFASATRLWHLAHRAPTVVDRPAPASLADLPDADLASGASAIPAVSGGHGDLAAIPTQTGAATHALSAPGITWRGISFSYPSEDGVPREPALSGIDAEAPGGRHTCLVGASGSGKSTLAQLVVRFADPDAGAVLLGGTDVRDLRLQDLRSTVTHLSQRPFLFNQSVAANLRLANPDATLAELEAACRTALIHDHIASLPAGYDTQVGELAGRWSGGQRSRLALARALLTGASVFILDEYNAHLDPDLAHQLAAGLRKSLPDATLIEVTHRVANSLTADHVIVLDQGRVVETGRPADLAATSGAYARLLAREP